MKIAADTSRHGRKGRKIIWTMTQRGEGILKNKRIKKRGRQTMRHIAEKDEKWRERMISKMSIQIKQHGSQCICTKMCWQFFLTHIVWA